MTDKIEDEIGEEAAPVMGECLECAKPIKRYRKTQRFCGLRCRVAYMSRVNRERRALSFTCPHCGGDLRERPASKTQS